MAVFTSGRRLVWLILFLYSCDATERLRSKLRTSKSLDELYGDGTPLGLTSWLTTVDDSASSTFAGSRYSVSSDTDQSQLSADASMFAMPQSSQMADLQNSLSNYHVDKLVSVDPMRFQYISYDRQAGTTEGCKQFERQGERLPSDRGYWPGLDSTGGEYLYGTVWGQDAIWRHQHPADCSKANVVLLRSFPSGIGSVIDITAHMLSVAFRAGHVVMWHPNDATAWAGSWCGATKSLDCFLEPITNCTVENSGLDVSSATVLQMENASTMEPVVAREQQQHPLEGMEEMLQCSPIDESVQRHWFKNQATAFITRPNQQVLDELASRQQSMFHFESPSADANAFHTLSMHIRWSEAKRNEANLVPIEQMWEAAQALQHVDPRVNRLFVSTENADAIEQAKRLPGWEATFVDVKRTGSDSYEQTKSGEIQPDEEMLNSLLNLQLALQSDAFICNRYSNWCGLIDSLRLTAARKADRPLLDNGGACKFCNGDYSSMLYGLCPKCPW